VRGFPYPSPAIAEETKNRFLLFCSYISLAFPGALNFG
jgi:hypothetical protein